MGLAKFYERLLGWSITDLEGPRPGYLPQDAWALKAGAVLAEHQPQQDVRVLLDPAGHPFCLFADKI